MKSINGNSSVQEAAENPWHKLRVVAKFYYSKAPDGTMQCISRTLGKLAIVESGSPAVPNHSLWLCEIVKETRPGKNYGAFILRPLESVDPSSIRKIIPGFYDLSERDRVAVLRPNSDPHHFWVLSKATRQIFSRKYNAVIVPVEERAIAS
jgi:hypothetical protein